MQELSNAAVKSGFFPSQMILLLLLPPYVHCSPETEMEES